MTSVFTLNRLVAYNKQDSNKAMSSDKDQMNFYQTASNLLDKQNIETWREIEAKVRRQIGQELR